jgi:RNA polymerase sigma-70 factor, ECF subfamily
MSARMDSEQEWIRVFRETLPNLYGFVSRRVGGDRALAEDITQETWLRALQAWRSGGVAREPLAWLQTVARRLILNHARDARSAPATAEYELGSAPASEPSRPWTSDDLAALRHGLARLDDAEAALLDAFHFDGSSTRELAERYRTSERAIEGRLHRARAKLRRILHRSLS